MRRLVLPLSFFFVFAGLCSSGSAQPLTQPQVHVVATGQRLESIARRYSVSIDALCNASGIQRNERLRIGQRLIVPAKGDDDGSAASKLRDGGHLGEASSRTVESSVAAKDRDVSPIARIHQVAPGQTLGKIARRYNVSTEAVQAANHLAPEHRLKPGEKLLIPNPGADLDGEKASVATLSDSTATRSKVEEKKSPVPQIHQIESGHTLGKVAKRYRVSVESIATANDLDPHAPLQPGKKLVIPVPGEEGSKAVRQLRAELDAAEETAAERSGRRDGMADMADPRRAKPVRYTRTRTWKFYAERPRHKGYVTLTGWNNRWQGYVVGKGNKVLPGAFEAVSRLMGAVGDRPRADPRLIKLLADVSDTFGGRPIRVVSGFRTESFFLDSRHRHSRAIDFSIPGVPNEALKDYLLTLKSAGVGYYPNSSFVHLDTRETKTYWVDYAGPGEAPRTSPHAPSRAASAATAQEPAADSADLDGPPEYSESPVGATQAVPSGTVGPLSNGARPPEESTLAGSSTRSGASGGDDDRNAGASPRLNPGTPSSRPIPAP